MAKISIPASTVAVNNIQLLDDVVVGQATSLKETFDKVGLDTKTYINSTLIPALNGDTGSNMIGHDSPNIASDNVKDALEEVYSAIQSTVLGEIPNNSITNAKLATDVKVGSLATLTTTEKTSVVGAINEIDAYVDGVPEQADTIETNLAILRQFKTTTGSNVALAVDTAGTFDLTLEGNILNILPNVTNTGAMTINADGQGAKSIKKFNADTDAYVDVEAGDIKKNTPTSLSRSVSNDFFVYAPKGGANLFDKLKNATTKNGTPSTNTVSTSSRLSVSGSGWVIAIGNPENLGVNNVALKIDGSYVLGSATVAYEIANEETFYMLYRFTTSFEYFDSTAGRGLVYYCLGDKIETASHKVYAGTSGSTETLRVNKTGSGWIQGLSTGNTSGANPAIKLIVDSVEVHPSKFLKCGIPYLIRFNTGFQFYSSATNYLLTYTDD